MQKGVCNNNIALMAEEAMISLGIEEEPRTTNSSSIFLKAPCSEQGVLSKPPKIEIKVLEIERRSPKQLELSEDLVETLLPSRKRSTNLTCHRVWKVFGGSLQKKIGMPQLLQCLTFLNSCRAD